jgi:predicted Zn-dependent peptidase
VINSWILSNNARLVVEEIPHVRSAAIGIYIKVGSRHEPDHLSGVSHFIEHMLFKGSEKRSAREIAESFEGLGGQLNAFTSREYTCVYARTLDENIFKAADIIFDMVFNSAFSAKEFNTEKGVIIEEINMLEDAPDDLIHDLFFQKLWDKHPMGNFILGTTESVLNCSREEAYKFYKSCYIPSNMVIAVAGQVNKLRIRDLVEEYLQKQSFKETELISPQTQGYYPFINLNNKDTEQVQICIGVPGISYFDNDRYTQSIMNSILGGGMSSRLFQTIREEMGLAYSVYSYPSNYSDTGAYTIYIGTGNNKIEKFFEVLYSEIEKFTSKGVNDNELSRTKQLMKSSIYLGLENVMNRMNRIGKSMLMYDKLIPVDEVINNILSVDKEMVQYFSSRLLDRHKFSLAAIGPVDALNKADKEYRKWSQ